MTMAADSAVPIVARVAELLGLPGIGSETAHLATNKIAMRREFAERGVPQPQFAALRRQTEVRAAARDGRLPRGAEARRLGGPARHLPRARRRRAPDADGRSRSPRRRSEEVIVERYHHGREVNTLLVARDDDVHLITALRPPPPRRHRLRRRARAPLPVDALRRRARGGGARRASQRCARSACATGSRIRSCSSRRTTTRCASSRSRRASPAGRWSRSRATASASTSSRSRCCRRSASRCPTSS